MCPNSVHELAVIFDLDGLLADTEPLWSESARVLLERRGRSYDPGLKTLFMGRPPAEVARIMKEHYSLQGRVQELLAERLEILEQLYATGPVSPMPGAIELVTDLEAEDVPMAVASGSPGYLVRTVLETLGLRKQLPVALGSDEVDRGKPAPDLFLLAARRLGATADRCVVLEDAPAGVQAALAAGMACVAVPSPDVSAGELAAHLTVSCLSELTPALLARVINARRS
jgi:HAD superfamily hydrolase (TIGR01509 family)